MKKGKKVFGGDFIIEEEDSDDDRIDNKNKKKENIQIKKKLKPLPNILAQNSTVNDTKFNLALEKKKSSTKKLRTIPSSFQKNYNSNIGVWTYLNFTYAFDSIKNFIEQGKIPNIQDFPYPLKNENIDYYFQKLQEAWDKLVEQKRNQIRKCSFLLENNESAKQIQIYNNNNQNETSQNQQINGKDLRDVIRSRYHKGLVKCGLLGLFDSLLRIICCVQMGRVMKMIQDRSLPEQILYSQLSWIINILILFISLVIGTYCKTWFFHYAFELASKIRFSLIALIYDKVQQLNVGVLSIEIQPGRIINMCANDLNDLDYGLSWVFQLLILPINLFLSTLIIYYYLGIYSIVGVITLIVFIGMQEYYTTKVSEPLKKKNKQTDLRINLAKQLITYIKILKMYSWDNIFQSQINQVRKEELDLTRNVMECISIARSISNGSVLFSAFIMCVLYHYLSDGTLTYEKIFSSLSILNAVKSSLAYFSCGRGWLENIGQLSERVAQVLISKKQPIIQDLNDDYNSMMDNENFFNLIQKNKDVSQLPTAQYLASQQKTTENCETDRDQQNYQNQNIEFNKINNEQQSQKEIQSVFSSQDKSSANQKKQWKFDDQNKDISSNLQLQQSDEQKQQIPQESNQPNIKRLPSDQSISSTTKISYSSFKKVDGSNQLYSIKEKKYQKSESERDNAFSLNESSSSSNDEKKRNKYNSNNVSIKMSNFDAFWDSNIATLENININLTNQFKFVQIIGKSGSGKSSLLLSVLQEINHYSGLIQVSGKISYVPQEAVIYTGTIKQNILFGSEYDYVRYSHVKALCNLNEDLDKLPKKDDTYLLEGGSSLSGGQKMRINLARALYSKSQILLLDDPLAALDAKVSEKIFKKMFKTKFLNGRLVLMSSHQLQYSQEADYILILDEGKIREQGTFDQLQQIIKELQYNEQKEREKNEEFQGYENELQQNIFSASGTSRENSFSSYKVDSLESSDMEGNDEALRQLSLDMMKGINLAEGYKNYITNMGGIEQLTLLIILYLLTELSHIFFSTYFGKLSNTDSNQIVITCGLFAVTYLILDLCKSLYFCKLNFFASQQLHSNMLNSVTKAPMSFFAQTSIGNIINRFSNDVGVLDKTLPACLLDLIRGLTSNLILIITVCIFNFPLIPFAVLILSGLVYTRKQFSQVISISKQADLCSRSPIFNQLSECMTNLTVIRVFNQQERFKASFLRAIYDNTRAFYAMSKNQRMFDLYLELIITGMIVVGISYILISLFLFKVEGSSVTLSIYFLINLGYGFSYAVRQTLTADINMLSTQRIFEFTKIESEETITQNPNQIPQDSKDLQNFPQKGQISFNNINLRYPNDIKLTLKKLSFNVTAGQKIGVVGRTGAGKSSLINVLFRLYPLQYTPNVESSIKIDGINIEDIELSLLRNSISIIPQEPVIFQGNARFNLDPIGNYTDQQLYDTLKEVGLQNKVISLEDDLQSLSVGEKQLICLARAFLKDSKILILDEVTANLDKTIDEFIQEKIRIFFKDKTIIAIAHRLISIADYDKILVLENGFLKDYDHPFSLLVENENDTKITKKKTIFAGLVKNTGLETAFKIMQKSRDSFFKSKYYNKNNQTN